MSSDGRNVCVIRTNYRWFFYNLLFFICHFSLLNVGLGSESRKGGLNRLFQKFYQIVLNTD